MQIKTNLTFNDKDYRTRTIPTLKYVSFNLHAFFYHYTRAVKMFTSNNYERLGNKILESNKTYYPNEKRNMIFHCDSFSFLTYIF